MNYERELKNELEESQINQSMRNKAKWKMGFSPIVSFTKLHLP